MALSRTLHYAGQSATSTASLTSSSFTPPDNSLLVVWACTGDAHPATAAPSITDTAGLTWTSRQLTQATIGGWHMYVRAWTAPVTTGSPMTVTVSGAQAFDVGMAVFSYTGYDTSTPTGATATRTTTATDGAITLTLSAAPAADSDVLGALMRANDTGANTQSTPGTGWTEVVEGSMTEGDTLNVIARTGSTSTSVSWADINSNSAALFASIAAALEIKAGASSSVELTVANTAQTHASTSPTLGVALSANDTAQSQASGNVTLGTGVALAVADTGQTQASGAPALTQHHTLVVASSAQTQASQAVAFGRFPADVDATNRYFVDQNGDPWFGVGDAAWSLCAQLSTTDITTYLEDRAGRGINFVLVNLVEHQYADNAPNNFYDESPFTGTAFQSTLNDDYWQTVDHMMDEAKRLGITVLACPAYLGFPASDQGWNDEVVASYNVSSGAGLTSYGQALAARYPSSTYPNIVWLIGHDRVPSTTEKAAEKLIADELPSGHLMLPGGNSAEWGDDGFGLADWASSGISFDGDTVYTYDEDPASMMASVWSNDAGPGGFLEGGYEGEQNTDQERRAYLYGTLCAGGTFAFFGNSVIWNFGQQGGTWEDELDSTGSVQLSYLADLIAEVGPAWGETVPDTTDTFQTTGSGTARFSTLLGLIYATAGVTLDLTEIAGSSALVRWFDPTDGSFTAVDTYATSGSQAIADPGANSAGAQDWILVVETTGEYDLTVADTAQSQASTGPTLGVSLTVNDTAQAQASSAPTLGVALSVADTAQGQASTTPTLTVGLVVNDTAQAHASTAPALTQHNVLVVVDTAQGQASGNVTLAVAGQLGAQDTAQTQASTSPSLTQHHTLAVASSAQGQASTSPTLTVSLTVADSAQGQASGTVTLSVGGSLAAADTAQGQASTSPALTQHHVLVVASTGQAQASALVRFGTVGTAQFTFGHLTRRYTYGKVARRYTFGRLTRS